MHHVTSMNTAPAVAIGIIAWNEEAAIPAMLESLFAQTVFGELAAQNLSCEIICIVNGSTDRTASIARARFDIEQREHFCRDAFTARVVEVEKRGKINSWNLFVH
jgi:glycosyltransferase involved in cell wall biosynthesis